MPEPIREPSRVAAAGEPPKLIGAGSMNSRICPPRDFHSSQPWCLRHF
jgi:hypothetical protein